MATIVYLDADDEITSAAMRIRQAADSRVALVIPFGSRVATSRINFKLLAREAQVNGRRLDIVAPDASARALASSAGIGVFASVGEYESALDAPPPDDPASGLQRGGAPGAGIAAAGAAAGVASSTAGAAGAAGAAGSSGAGTPPSGPDAARAGTGFAATAAPDPGLDSRGAAAREAELDAIVRRGREVPVVKPPRRRGRRRGLVIGLLVLLLAIAVAGVAGYLLLPSAEIAVTPRVELVGPIQLTIRADPGATAVDEAAGVIPAQTVTIPVEVSGEFPATGKRVETTRAQGGVRWTNCDPSSNYSIPRGTVVRTGGGIGFAIAEAVFLPVAIIDVNGGTANVKCQSSEVAVNAVEAGPDGNVGAGTIRVIPARYNRNLIRVTNPSPTTGGTRQEFTLVSKKDVEAAVVKLHQDLDAAFQAQLAAPDGVPAGATVLPETAVLGEATPDPDPVSLVNDEVDTFTLALRAEGTVLAVDTSPVEAIAQAALADAVTPGYRLVDGSTRVVVGDATVEGGTVVVPVAGTAKQVRPVDGEALRRQVLGLPRAAAEAALAPYGDVRVTLWPGFVTAVPSLEGRVVLVVREPLDETPSVEPIPPTPAPTESPGESPSGSPDGEVPSEPLPSG